MKALFLTLTLLFMLPTDADAQFLNEYQWKSRLVLVFTPSPSDPMFIRQMQLLRDAQEEFEERNVVFITITPRGDHENTGLFLDQEASKQYYDYFSVAPYQLELVLVGLDSNEKLRAKNRITAPSVILTAIDRMPMRRREILRGKRTKSQVDDGK